MDDEARAAFPDIRGDRPLEVGSDDELWAKRLHRRAHLPAVGDDAAADIVAEVVQLDEDALRQAVEGAGKQQYAHEAVSTMQGGRA
jgi:hypothetical protein